MKVKILRHNGNTSILQVLYIYKSVETEVPGDNNSIKMGVHDIVQGQMYH